MAHTHINTHTLSHTHTHTHKHTHTHTRTHTHAHTHTRAYTEGAAANLTGVPAWGRMGSLRRPPAESTTTLATAPQLIVKPLVSEAHGLVLFQVHRVGGRGAWFVGLAKKRCISRTG